MQNGLIPDVAINASSQLSSNRGAQNGRLGNSKSWTAANKNTIQWLQVDFGRIVEITQIATQGREGAKEWVKEYYLQYSNNESQFVTYENHKVDVFFYISFFVYWPHALSSCLVNVSSRTCSFLTNLFFTANSER